MLYGVPVRARHVATRKPVHAAVTWAGWLFGAELHCNALASRHTHLRGSAVHLPQPACRSAHQACQREHCCPCPDHVLMRWQRSPAIQHGTTHRRARQGWQTAGWLSQEKRFSLHFVGRQGLPIANAERACISAGGFIVNVYTVRCPAFLVRSSTSRHHHAASPTP